MSATLGACATPSGASPVPKPASTRPVSVPATPTATPLVLAPTRAADQPTTLPENLPRIDLDPANFTAVVDNAYLPRVPGSRFVYEGQTESGFERVELEVLTETKTILGISTTVVRDTVTLDGAVIEDTYDWIAQDTTGNVWYFGEDVSDYQDGKLTSKTGSWEAGVDGALPGILMPADPTARVGETFLQEYDAGEAEDTARILKADVSIETPMGVFDQVVQTYEFTPLDPESQEHKFFAAGLGSIKIIDLTTGDEKVLIEYVPAAGSTVHLPVAQEGARVDRVEPVFSDPAQVTHPLFPYSQTQQLLLLGQVDGQPLHVVYTLLPDTRAIEWNGQSIDTIVVQYSATLNGRIIEVARDWYAQADDGSVWYFGEDVFNYVDGEVADTHGTWLAGRDGPLAMIMPANPRVGDVFRVENIPGLVFEEITVKATGVTVAGPNGPVPGAMWGDQFHLDGSLSNKTFAPGYGEFATIKGTELEALALAVPTDARPGGVPAELDVLASGAQAVFADAASGDWIAAAETLDRMRAAWQAHEAGAPDMLAAQLSEALVTLTAAVNTRQPAEARQAALAVALADLDLQLQYRPVAEVDLERAAVWSQQALLDAVAGDRGGVLSDVVTLELIHERAAHALDAASADRFAQQVAGLRAAAEADALDAAADAAASLLEVLSTLQPGN